MAGDREDSRLQKERLGQEAKATNFDWATVISPEDPVAPPPPLSSSPWPLSVLWSPPVLTHNRKKGTENSLEYSLWDGSGWLGKDAQDTTRLVST